MGNSYMASEVMKSNKVSLNFEGLSSSMQQTTSEYNSITSIYYLTVYKYNNVKENIKAISLTRVQFLL